MIEEDKENQLQQQVKAEILHIATIIKTDREGVKRVLSASITTTRLQIRASDESVQAIKYRYNKTRNLLRLQYGYRLVASQHDSAASAPSNMLDPKPSKVKVQNLLIRPEHLVRLPTCSVTTLPSKSANSNLRQSAGKLLQSKPNTKDRKNELVSAWEGSMYKKVLAQSLSIKLLQKMCFMALHHNAHIKRVVRQAACLSDVRRKRVLLLLCFRSILFEALSTRYISLTCSARVDKLNRNKYLIPAVEQWQRFAKYRAVCSSLSNLSATFLKNQLQAAGLHLLVWNRARAKQRRYLLTWAYRRCRATRLAKALYSWVFAYASVGQMKRMLTSRATREKQFAKAQSKFLLYKGKKQYRYQNTNLSAIEAPSQIQQTNAQELKDMEKNLAELRKEIYAKILHFGRVPVVFDVFARDPSWDVSMSDVNSLATLASMNTSFSFLDKQNKTCSFLFTPSAQLNPRRGQVVADLIGSSSASSLDVSKGRSRLGAKDRESSKFTSGSNYFLSRTIVQASPTNKFNARSPTGSTAMTNMDSGIDVGDLLRDRIFASLSKQLENDRVLEAQYGPSQQFHSIGTPSLSRSWAKWTLPSDHGLELVEEDLQAHAVGTIEYLAQSSLILLELSSRMIRRCRWALMRLRKSANLHISSRLLKKQTRTNSIVKSLHAWLHVEEKNAQKLALCDSIWRRKACSAAVRKFVRVFFTNPEIRTDTIRNTQETNRRRRALLQWRRTYWNVVAESQLSKMARTSIMRMTLCEWNNAYKQRRSTRGLRNRISRRTVTPMFKMWHLKAHKAAVLRRVFLIREAAWQYRYNHTIHQSTFTRLHSTFTAWADTARQRVALRKEKHNVAQALRFRLVTLIGRPFFAWSDLIQRNNRVVQMVTRRITRSLKFVLIAWRAAAEEFRLQVLQALRYHRHLTLRRAIKGLMWTHMQGTVEYPRRHRMNFLTRQVFEHWKVMRRARELAEMQPRWDRRKLKTWWKVWRSSQQHSIRLHLAVLLLDRVHKRVRQRRAIDGWPGRSEWRLAEEMRQAVLTRGPGRSRLVDTVKSETSARKSVEFANKIEAHAKEKSFLERIAMPIEQRAAVFGMIYSSNDLRSVAKLLEMLKAVLFAWSDAAHVTRVMRGKARLIKLKHGIKEQEAVFRYWMGRASSTAHRTAQWIAKASVRPHTDYVNRLQNEKKRLEAKFILAAGVKGVGEKEDAALEEDIARYFESQWGVSKELDERQCRDAGLARAAASDGISRTFLKKNEQEALTRAFVNRVLKKC